VIVSRLFTVPSRSQPAISRWNAGWASRLVAGEEAADRQPPGHRLEEVVGPGLGVTSL